MTYSSRWANIRIWIISVLGSRCLDTLSLLKLALARDSRQFVSASSNNRAAILFFFAIGGLKGENCRKTEVYRTKRPVQ